MKPNNRQTLGPVDLSTPVMMRGIRKKEMVGSKHVNPQAVQLSPGIMMGSQVNQR